jgi:O-antigen ligase
MKTAAAVSRPSASPAGVLLLGLAVVAFATSTAVLDWDVEAILLTALVPALLMFYDYRFGLALLIFILPFENAKLLPKLGPLNALNVLILGVVIAFLLQAAGRRFTARPLAVLVPRTLLLYYVVPLVIAVVVGSMHFKEISSIYLVKTHPDGYTLGNYWVSDFFKKGLLVAVACVLASTVYAARNGRRWIVMLTLASMVFVLAQVALVLATGVGADQLQRSRAFFIYLGRQNNEAGTMLVTAFAPVLFMREMVTAGRWRLALTVGALALIVGILLTGSRGAFVAMLAVVAMYLLHFRRLRTAFFVITVAVVGVALAPDAVQDRLLRGLENRRIESLDSRSDELSAGRFFIWQSLAPEIARSPVYGRGLMSTQWSRFVRSGAFSASHPHNLYLEILMDIGIYGAICMFVVYRWAWKSFRRLAKDERFDPLVRGYFLGASAGLLGMLVYGIPGGHWYPAPEQVFFWLALGLAIGYSKVAADLPAPAMVAERKRRQPFGLGLRRPARRLEPALR